MDEICKAIEDELKNSGITPSGTVSNKIPEKPAVSAEIRSDRSEIENTAETNAGLYDISPTPLSYDLDNNDLQTSGNGSRTPGQLYSFTFDGVKYEKIKLKYVMLTVFKGILPRNEDKLDLLLNNLSCLKEGDVISPKAHPTTFRAGETITVGTRRVSIGTSLNKESVFKFINKVIALCGEENAFVLNNAVGDIPDNSGGDYAEFSEAVNNSDPFGTSPAADTSELHEEYKLIRSKNDSYCAVVKVTMKNDSVISYTLLKGSRLRSECASSVSDSAVKIWKESCGLDSFGHFTALRDIEKSSPSAITSAIKGASDNGVKTIQLAQTISEKDLGQFLKLN